MSHRAGLRHGGLHHVVPLGRDDVPEIVRIERLSNRPPWGPEAFLGEFTSPFTRAFGVRGPFTGLAGFLFMTVVIDEAHVSNFAVDPSVRRGGVGSALLDHAVVSARGRGAAVITLEARRSNLAALALYRSKGFAEAAVRPGYYGDDGEDAVVMRLETARSP